MRGGKLVIVDDAVYDETPARDELAEVVTALGAAGGYMAMRQATAPEDWLQVQKVLAELSSGMEAIDDETRFRVFLKTKTAGELAKVLNRLSSLPLVLEASAECDRGRRAPQAGAMSAPPPLLWPTQPEMDENARGTTAGPPVGESRRRAPPGGRPPTPPRPR